MAGAGPGTLWKTVIIVLHKTPVAASVCITHQQAKALPREEFIFWLKFIHSLFKKTFLIGKMLTEKNVALPLVSKH